MNAHEIVSVNRRFVVRIRVSQNDEHRYILAVQVNKAIKIREIAFSKVIIGITLRLKMNVHHLHFFNASNVYT